MGGGRNIRKSTRVKRFLKHTLEPLILRAMKLQGLAKHSSLFRSSNLLFQEIIDVRKAVDTIQLRQVRVDLARLHQVNVGK